MIDQICMLLVLLLTLLGIPQNPILGDCNLNQLTASPAKSYLKQHRNWHLLPHGNCGHRKFTPKRSLKKIFVGTDAAKDEFPWIAKMNAFGGGTGGIHCSGSVISDRYILTAGHCCLITGFAKDITWYLGSNYLYLSARTIRSEKVFVHEDYSKCIAVNVKKNDVCLVRLSEKIDLSDNIQPICVPIQADIDQGVKMEVAGWGVCNPETGEHPTFLQKKVVTVVGQNICREKNPNVDAREICTTYGSCYGDSGAPLMKALTVEGKETYWNFGITSYGPDNCPIGSVILYARVTEYAEWILDHMEP